MKSELIDKITAAEAEVAAEKENAAARADEALKEAAKAAKNTLAASTEVCKAYAETQMKLATAQGEKAYADAVNNAKEGENKRAKDALQNAETVIAAAVERIIGGGTESSVRER